MKCFLGYMKYHFKWGLALLSCGIMMAAVMALNGIPDEEILYGLFLCLVLFAVIMAGDFSGYWKKYKRLKEMEHSVTVTLEGILKTDEPLQQEYQILVKKLFEENRRLTNEFVQRERDLMEYYTLWVHQIKTPIAALKLLLEEGAVRESCDEKGSAGQGEGEWEESFCNERERNEELQELFRIEQYAEMALQYMRLGSEITDFVLKKVDLDAVIREAVHKYAKQFIRKKIALNYDKVDTMVLTDEKWLEFVIEQLLSNALKYTSKGSISIYVEDGKLILTDTGIGIRQEDLPRVCEKGYTGYNGHADKRSTGIGLYLCSSILKKLGHTFVITSEEGSGTSVRIGF